MTLDAYLTAREDRCTACGYHRPTQSCACIGLKEKSRGQAIATAAHSEDAVKVDAAIRQLAATGRPFSANDARALHGIKGGVVGARFTSAHKAGLIRPVGDETSTDKGTHGHRIFRWVGVAA